MPTTAIFGVGEGYGIYPTERFFFWNKHDTYIAFGNIIGAPPLGSIVDRKAKTKCMVVFDRLEKWDDLPMVMPQIYV